MTKPTKFMKDYNIGSDEIWEVRRGGAWAIKHSALERVAAEQKIAFDEPKPLEARGIDQCAALVVTGRMGDRVEWSIGEAAPGNNKNAYPYAMAEKRGKDRVILKLLNAHGAVYSEEEAEEFERRQNPHVTRPGDIFDMPEHDDNGQTIDNIPYGENPDGKRLSKAKAREDFSRIEFEIFEIDTEAELNTWGHNNKDRIQTLPADWEQIIRGIYKEHLTAIRTGQVQQRKAVA